MRLIAGPFIADHEEEGSSGCKLIGGGGWKVVGRSENGALAFDFGTFMTLLGGWDWGCGCCCG